MADALANVLRQRYNFSLERHPELLQELVDWIANIPSRKVRRRKGLGLLAQHLVEEPTFTDSRQPMSLLVFGFDLLPSPKWVMTNGGKCVAYAHKLPVRLRPPFSHLFLPQPTIIFRYSARTEAAARFGCILLYVSNESKTRICNSGRIGRTERARRVRKM